MKLVLSSRSPNSSSKCWDYQCALPYPYLDSKPSFSLFFVMDFPDPCLSLFSCCCDGVLRREELKGGWLYLALDLRWSVYHSRESRDGRDLNYQSRYVRSRAESNDCCKHACAQPPLVLAPEDPTPLVPAGIGRRIYRPPYTTKNNKTIL